MAMRFSIGCGRTTPSALATASASVIMRLTIATISGGSAIAPSVAPVSTATGFQHRLLIILVQISPRMLPCTGARISASIMACASATTRSERVLSGSPIGSAAPLPSWRMTPGSVTSAPTQ
jgi:hypothetical protein